MTTENNEYSADKILTLDQIALARKRIGVYLGGTDSGGATTGLRELVDNSFDEGLAGHGDTVIVRLFEDGSAEVEDHGRGLPVDENKAGVNGIILTIGTIGSGGKFSGDTVSGGLNGMGGSAVNFSASRLDVTVYRGGQMHQLSFREGIPGFFSKPNDPKAPFTKDVKIRSSKDPRSAAEKKKHPTGTKIRYWLDHTVFTPDAAFLVDDIKARLKATCFLLPNMTAIVEDYRDPSNPDVESYHFNSGIEEMVPTLTNFPLISKVIKIKFDTSFTELTNVVQKDTSLKQQEVTRPVGVELAFAYDSGEATNLKSFVNLIQTRDGGTHEDGLWRALSRVMINYIKSGKDAKFLKVKEAPPTMEDVRDGFVGAIAVSFPEPVFSGQAKAELRSEQISGLLSQTIGEELKGWLESPKNKVEAKKIASRIVEASRIRLAAKAQKDTARKKSALETSASMPSKLVECANAGIGSVGTELLIVEGDSALGGMRKARMSEYQALLPLRGKIMNVRKASLSAILAQAECINMIQSIGAGSGKSFDIKDMRYERVIIASDADVDGAHIAVLLINFFWRMMPELIKQGKLYILVPPLYEIRYKEKGKEQVAYAVDDSELQSTLATLRKQRVKDIKIDRNKGLGEMDAGPIWDTLLNPENRRVKQVTVDDIKLADEILELSMGEDVLSRREWIIENRDKVSDLV